MRLEITHNEKDKEIENKIFPGKENLLLNKMNTPIISPAIALGMCE